MMIRRTFILMLLLCAAVVLQAQEPVEPEAPSQPAEPQAAAPQLGGPHRGGTILCLGTVLDGDTIPLIHLKPVRIVAKFALLTDKEIKKNQKLIRNVRKVLPYAKEARRRLQDLDRELASMSSSKRKEYTKQVEQEILDEFYDDLEHLTFSQGKVLLKLVDRETGNSSYALVADVRGKFRASFYNTFARMFGFNMKERFDPKRNKEDNLIDRIARSIEFGRL